VGSIALVRAIATGAVGLAGIGPDFLVASAKTPLGKDSSDRCYAKTFLAAKRGIDFVTRCPVPRNRERATRVLVRIRTNVPVRRVRKFAAVGTNPTGLRCREAGRYLIRCKATSGYRDDEKIRGRFKIKGGRCRRRATFEWQGGGCVGYDPETGACADVGLNALLRAGTPVGCS